MKARAPSAQALTAVLCIAAASFALWPLAVLDEAWPEGIRDYLESRGQDESGARNLVSAIYLGYRGYDTLGETIVLLVAVSGAIGMIGAAGSKLAPGYADAAQGQVPVAKPTRRVHRRTELIDAVTGKLGPVVLVFGLYVMLFGHVSPGGGFQGGVVVASGIVFLGMGSKGAGLSPLVGAGTLARIEAAGFLALLLAAGLGIVSGAGFFAPPLRGVSPVGYIVALNAVIGLKVGAGIGFLCIAMLGETER